MLAPGLHTTVQDEGRRGFQDVGVPVSGALDRVALRLANALVGNAAGAPALEILVQGPALKVVAESVRLALIGGSGGLELTSGERRVGAPGRSLRLTRGETMRVAPLGDVICAYLAVEGGLSVPPCLGSASTYARGGFGGPAGRVLAAGDVLLGPLAGAAKRGEVALPAPFDPGLDRPIRVVLGPQDDYLGDEAIATFLSSRYTVSAQADRMGFRLDGPQLAHERGADIVSDAAVTGSIQVPGSGQPIVLMVDAQTTGGYAKIATVVSADVPVLGRRKPGQSVRFEAVDQPQAEALRREEEAQVRGMIAAFRPVPPERALDLEALYQANLIDGMVDALG